MAKKIDKPPDNKRLNYGKYEGRLISDIIIINPSYIKREVKKERIELPKHLKL